MTLQKLDVIATVKKQERVQGMLGENLLITTEAKYLLNYILHGTIS